MGLLKMSKQRAALKTTLRLLVMIREMLKAEGATDTSLFVAVRDCANLCGTALPNKDLISAEELEKIRAALKVGESKSPQPPELPVKGQMVILTPEQLAHKPHIIKPT